MGFDGTYINSWAQLFKASLRGQLVKRFTTLYPNTLINFVETKRSFCTHFLNTKILAYLRYKRLKF